MVEENVLKVLMENAKSIARAAIYADDDHDGVWAYFEGDAIIPNSKEKVLEDMARDMWRTSEIEINSSIGGPKWVGGENYNSLLDCYRDSFKEHVRVLLVNCKSPWYATLHESQ